MKKTDLIFVAVLVFGFLLVGYAICTGFNAFVRATAREVIIEELRWRGIK